MANPLLASSLRRRGMPQTISLLRELMLMLMGCLSLLPSPLIP
jgi:hypothetical protein